MKRWESTLFCYVTLLLLLSGLSYQSTFAPRSKTKLFSKGILDPPQNMVKVAVLGAGGGIGQPLSLLLKVSAVRLKF
jgi:hypothetical protein